MATPMQKEDFERRCKSLVSKLNDADFLANKGLGNEAGIFTFCYDPTLEPAARDFFRRVVSDSPLKSGINLLAKVLLFLEMEAYFAVSRVIRVT